MRENRKRLQEYLRIRGGAARAVLPPATRRPVGFERLDERVLLAVLSVSPQPGEDPAALLAEAVATANSTPEPDTIELAPANYDLSSLAASPADQAVLEITSDIHLIGTSPSKVSILPQLDSAVFAVRPEASLSLSRITVYGSMEPNPGALVPPRALIVDVGGVAELDQVAIIGLVDPERIDMSLATILIENAGTLTVRRSALIDSSGSAVKTGEATTRLVDTTVAGASVVGLVSSRAIAQRDESSRLDVEDSILFRNGLGVFSSQDTTIAGSTITENGRGEFGVINGGFVGVAFAENPPTFDLGSDNVIAGNFLLGQAGEVVHGQRGDITILGRDPSADPIESIGTPEQGKANLESVIAKIEEGILLTDEVLEGVNVDLVMVDEKITVQSRGLGVSSVLWNEAAGRFRVDVAVQQPLSQLTVVADELVPLDAGRIVGGGLSVDLSIHSVFTTTGNLTSPQRAAWQLATLQSVTSESGANVTVRRDGQGKLLALKYHSLEDFVGTDTVTVVGESQDGEPLESTITVDVTEVADVTFNVAASDLNEAIDVAVSSSGLGRVSQFELTFSYDPSSVELVGTEYGRGFPFLQRTDESPGRVTLSAFNGFSTGHDLVMLNFRRIADGSANIKLASATFTQAGTTQQLVLGAAEQQYFFLAQDDTNRDGNVTASDALRVINRLGQDSEETSESSYDRELDTNGDSRLSASDALRVINRIGVVSNDEVDQSEHTHAVFSPDALPFLSTDEEIPSFVARPNLPLDDGTPADFVNVTPPTPQEYSSAVLITPGTDGVSTQSSLQSVTTLDLYVIEPTTDRLGFGLTARDGSHADFSITIWDAEGTLLDAYPTKASSGIPGGIIDVTIGEPIYFRIGSKSEDSLSYIFDTLSMT